MDIDHNNLEQYRHEVETSNHEALVESQAQDWLDQINESGYIYRDVPYRQDTMTYLDLVDFAKQDGITYPYDREDEWPILLYTARAYLSGAWD